MLRVDVRVVFPGLPVARGQKTVKLQPYVRLPL